MEGHVNSLAMLRLYALGISCQQPLGYLAIHDIFIDAANMIYDVVS